MPQLEQRFLESSSGTYCRSRGYRLVFLERKKLSLGEMDSLDHTNLVVYTPFQSLSIASLVPLSFLSSLASHYSTIPIFTLISMMMMMKMMAKLTSECAHAEHQVVPNYRLPPSYLPPTPAKYCTRHNTDPSVPQYSQCILYPSSFSIFLSLLYPLLSISISLFPTPNFQPIKSLLPRDIASLSH